MGKEQEAQQEEAVQEEQKLQEEQKQQEAGAAAVLGRRWLMLALFAAVSAANAAHWLQFAIIAGTAQRFYGVGAAWVQWTSTVFMAAYVPLVLPAAWLTERRGLRAAVAAGAGLTAAGAWLKVAGAAPGRFGVAFAGQALVAAAQVFTLGAPARVAALWFPPGQVATACALGVLGNQVGVALGFVVPPAVVAEGGDAATTARQLLALHAGLAAAPTLLFALVLWLFEAAPPPAPAAPPPERLPLRPAEEEEPAAAAPAAPGGAPSFAASLRRLARDRDFLLLWLAYGLNVGVFYAVSTLLGAMVAGRRGEGGDAEALAGRVGLAMVAAGVAGAAAGGLALDRWRRFKALSLLAYAAALAAQLAFAQAVARAADAQWPLFGGAVALGFFAAGYLGVGYEYAAALTWPVAESTSSGLLNAASELCGLALTTGAGALLAAAGDVATNAALAAALALGLALTACVRGGRLRRAHAGDAVRPAAPAPPPEKFLG